MFFTHYHPSWLYQLAETKVISASRIVASGTITVMQTVPLLLLLFEASHDKQEEITINFNYYVNAAWSIFTFPNFGKSISWRSCISGGGGSIIQLSLPAVGDE